MGPFIAIVKNDMRLTLRQGMDGILALAFFVVGVALFPFAVGPDGAILQEIAAAILWVMALLAAFLSLERLFHGDYEDGTLEQIVLSPMPLEVLILAKVLAHWLMSALPLVLISPLLGVLLHLPTEQILPMITALMLGTPSLSLIGAVGSALILGARRGGVLLALLVLPLYIPVLIFGVSVATTVPDTFGGSMGSASFMLLAAVGIFMLAVCPLLGALGIRLALE